MATFARAFAIFSFMFTVIFCLAAESHAQAKTGCTPGTYLVQEGSGTQSLWKFSADGTVQIASSAQGVFDFSDGLGAWKQTRSREAKATILDFNYAQAQLNGGAPPSAIVRVDAILSFSKKCATVQGSFQLRFFDPESEDPLNISTDSGNPVSDTLAGRLVTVFK